MSTKAQRWARKRNWYKGRLKGIKNSLINPDILTAKERHTLHKAASLINEVIHEWKSNNAESKVTYLKKGK